MADSQWFGIIVNAVATIVVAVIGYFGVRFTRRSAEEKRLQEQLDSVEKQKAEEQMDEILQAIKDLSGRVDDLAVNVETIKRDNDRQQHNIDQIAQLSKIGMDYTRSLSNVVTALAEGLRDNNIDGNVTHALESYREFESKQIDVVCKILTPNEDE